MSTDARVNVRCRIADKAGILHCLLYRGAPKPIPRATDELATFLQAVMLLLVRGVLCPYTKRL